MSDKEGRTLPELKESFNNAVDEIRFRSDEIDKIKAAPSDYGDDYDVELRDATNALAAVEEQAEKLKTEMESKEARQRSVERFQKYDTGNGQLRVAEPDIYTEHSEFRFFSDLYWSQVHNEPEARDRMSRHQAHEIEKRAITSANLGGIVPAQYLVSLYAKASRNGRVFADQANRQTLPDQGMSLILPRLTQGLAAAAQTTQNTAVVTQDVTETDLTVPVNTIAGYSPVSRQAIERAAYSDQILFEDLIARYWASLDSYCINGSGSNNQPVGLLNTGSISASTCSTATVAAMYPKIADVIQQIATGVGGLGYSADKIFMHPRRWGFFEAALDSSGRPLIVPSGPAFNQIGSDVNEQSIGLVGNMHGLGVYVDPNIPTTLGATTNADAIIITASPIVHLFERNSDPVALSFEQTGATNLTINLVCYGYVAFTAGRYPAGVGAVTGAGLVPPTF